MTNEKQNKENVPEKISPGSELIELIYKAIVDEATAADFYTRLMEDTNDELFRHFIEHARNDEQQHLKNFSALYAQITKHQPSYHITPVQYSSFREGAKKALQDELEAAEFYRNIILSTTDSIVNDVFFHAMIDELEHAIRFGVIYSTSK
jgi:rubrerythrin